MDIRVTFADGTVSFVASATGCSITVSLSQLSDGNWHALIPVTSHPGKYTDGYIAFHYVGETEYAYSVTGLASFTKLGPVAADCTEGCTNGMLQSTRDLVIRVGKNDVKIRVRMTPAWKQVLLSPTATALLRSEPILLEQTLQRDPSRVTYEIGTGRGSYAQLAAASYALKLESSDWKFTFRRFVRQTELAALLLGYNLSDPALFDIDADSIYRVSRVAAELAAELFLVPLRSHGRYTQDGMYGKKGGKDDVDFASIPLFNPPNEGRMVGFDCEDSTFYAVNDAEQLAALFRFLDVHVESLGITLDALVSEIGGIAQTDLIGASAIATVLSLAAKLVPLHVVVSMPKDGGKENSELHAISMLVGRSQIQTLFGDAWQLAVSADRLERVFIDGPSDMLTAKARLDSGLEFTQDEKIGAAIADGVPVCVMDACVFMNPCLSPHGSSAKWHHSWTRAASGHAKEQQRFRFGLDESSAIKLDYTIVGIYGAAAALNLESRKIAMSSLIFPFLGPTSIYSKDAFGEPFTYERIGPPTFLPGPSFPTALDQMPVPRATGQNDRPIVLSRHHSKNGTPIKLFADLAHSSLLVL